MYHKKSSKTTSIKRLVVISPSGLHQTLFSQPPRSEGKLIQHLPDSFQLFPDRQQQVVVFFKDPLVKKLQLHLPMFHLFEIPDLPLCPCNRKAVLVEKLLDLEMQVRILLPVEAL